jgi:hypothetical protein
MRVTVIHAQTERKGLDRSVRCAEKRRLIRPTMTPSLGLKHPQPDVCATPSRVRKEEMLDRTASTGELSVMSQATWGMSDEGKQIIYRVRNSVPLLARGSLGFNLDRAA